MGRSHCARLIEKRKFRADVAQLVEHSLGKGEVTSSILVIGSSLRKDVAGREGAPRRA